MKYSSARRGRRCCPSLPVRGAWIEIVMFASDYRNWCCRSPCGERGLKSLLIISLRALPKSLPVRGAWIEIGRAPVLIWILCVAPRAGSVD